MDQNNQSPSEGLGSLAQSARSKNLSTARWVLIIVGVLTCGVNLLMLVNVANEADRAIEAERVKAGPGAFIDPVKGKEVKETIIRFGQLLYGGSIVLGLVFIGLGLAVYQIPVAATVLGLILYIGGNLAFAALDPSNLARGLIVKIIIIVALVKAVQAAVAYERERREERAAALES